MDMGVNEPWNDEMVLRVNYSPGVWKARVATDVDNPARLRSDASVEYALRRNDSSVLDGQVRHFIPLLSRSGRLRPNAETLPELWLC